MDDELRECARPVAPPLGAFEEVLAGDHRAIEVPLGADLLRAGLRGATELGRQRERLQPRPRARGIDLGQKLRPERAARGRLERRRQREDPD